jgi:membrane-bound inhibitor of C-type lysozyme
MTLAGRLAVLAVGLLVAIPLAGCSASESGREPMPARTIDRERDDTFVYQCDAGFRFVARIEGERAWLFLPGETIELAPVPSSSGSRYASGEIELWRAGEVARLQTPEADHADCRHDRRQSIWEKAKLDGVDFRALGNEPPWILEIDDGMQRARFYSGYERALTELVLPEPIADPESRATLYRIERPSSAEMVSVEIRLIGEPCADSMSGEGFETRVEITQAGTLLRGCGRALH